MKRCAEILKNSDVKVCTVIGFPLGATSTRSKAYEAQSAVLDGAKEIDMVINVGEVKAGHYEEVTRDISAVKEAIGQITLKVILETCLLTKEEIVQSCLCAKEAGADFVKTSTGFSTGGATAEDVALMKKTVGDSLKVKASGGIRNKATMLEMIEAGADRIGASAGVSIMEDR